MGGYPPQPAAVVQGCRDLLGLMEMFEGPAGPPERNVHLAQIEPEVDGLLEPVPALGKAFKGRERLLEARPCFSLGRALDRPSPRLPEVGRRFLPRLSAKRV